MIREKVIEFKKGENPDRSRIGYYRNRGYRLFKQQLNPLASGTVDLILTGQFTRGLFVDNTAPREFLFDSNDEKTPLLIEKYGLDIMGINEEIWFKLQQERYAPELVKFIKQQIGQR